MSHAIIWKYGIPNKNDNLLKLLLKFVREIDDVKVSNIYILDNF